MKRQHLSTGALLGALIGLAMGSAWAGDPAAGAQVFSARQCDGCHYTQGPAREKTIEDQLAKKGPELWYAGSKFQQPWLAHWLQEPTPIRPLKYNSLTEENPADHPSLATGEAADVTAFLMSLIIDGVESGVVQAKSNPKGKLIFKKKMPCSGCHKFPDRKAVRGGNSGPSLVGAGERLNPDWILAYLKDPKRFKPIKMMPVFSGLMSAKDMEKVAAYVASF